MRRLPSVVVRHLPMKDPDAATAELTRQADDLRDCRACLLCEGRTQVVFGVGSPVADLMFVGEGPGFHEDRQGEPFVGAAGKLLTELLGTIGMTREDVYIANVVKCRPPDNRDPLPDEIEACSPNLVEQIRTIQPRVVCTLGRFATRLIAQTEAGISSVRGRVKPVEIAGLTVLVLPVFHPAAALYTPANRGVLEQDFRRLRVLLDRGLDVVPATADPFADPAAAAQRPGGFGEREPAGPAAVDHGGVPGVVADDGDEAGAVSAAGGASDPEPEQLALW